MTKHRRSFAARLRRSLDKRWRRLKGLPALPTKSPPPLRQPDENAPGVATAWLDIVKPYTPASPPGEVALFITHSRDGRTVRRHVETYVRALQAEGIGVVLIVASDAPDVAVPAGFAATLAGLYVRENAGFDFAAWAHVILRELTLFRAPALYLINDSLYGPFNAADFAALIRRIRAANADIIGLTESHEKGWHLQSFFLCMKQPAFSNTKFHRFWQDVRLYPDKQDVIDLYEVTFSGQMRAAGLTCTALFGNPTVDNRMALAWRELIADGLPFLKGAVVKRDPPKIDSEGWEDVLTARGYDITLVDDGPGTTLPPAAARVGPSFSRRRQALADRMQGAGPAVLRIAYIGSWGQPGAAGEVGRAMVSALFHTDHDINLCPAFAPTPLERDLAPAWTVHSFDGPADIVLGPLDAAELDDARTTIWAEATLRVGLWNDERPDGVSRSAWPMPAPDALIALYAPAMEALQRPDGPPVPAIALTSLATAPQAAARAITAFLLDLLPAR